MLGGNTEGGCSAADASANVCSKVWHLIKKRWHGTDAGEEQTFHTMCHSQSCTRELLPQKILLIQGNTYCDLPN
jgi:hypothetical protein